jgi:hypothetical protein
VNTVKITYHNRAYDVILSAESTAAFRADDLTVVDDVRSLATRNVEETGHACDVFADDEVTILLCVPLPPRKST